eukprot:gene14577-23113_t
MWLGLHCPAGLLNATAATADVGARAVQPISPIMGKQPKKKK